MKKILPYLLLNILVSAVTMLSVILIWNATHKTPVTFGSGNTPSPAIQSTDHYQPTLPPLNVRTIEIQSVLVPGDLANEKVVIKSVSENKLDLTGWSLTDAQDHSFTFPALSIYPGGAVTIYSRAGVNSAVELFWASDKPLWYTGEVVTLVDSAGNPRTDFTIP
jgi:hypothetical protein